MTEVNTMSPDDVIKVIEIESEIERKYKALAKREMKDKSLQEMLLEEFDYVEDLGYIDSSMSYMEDCNTVFVVANIKDRIITDGDLDYRSRVAKEYGINHQCLIYELKVNNPTYIIGARKTEDGSFYTTLYADYTKIDTNKFRNILLMRDNLIDSFNI